MSEKIVNQTELSICLLGLPAKDAAVFRRVIDFSARKGRNYQLLDNVAQAQLVIMNDNAQQCAQAKQQGASCCWLLVGNGRSEISDDTVSIYSIKRPLLVTRVMRELDVIADAIAVKAAKQAKEAERKAAITQAVLQAKAEPTTAPRAVPKEPLATKPKLEAKPKVTKTEVQVEQKAKAVKQEQTKLDVKAGKQVAAIAKPQASSIPKVVEKPKPEIKHRYHALVVDDSFAIRKQLELELRDAQIGADFAESGEVCLEKTAQNHYDLIFLDIMMPGIDGYEVCRRLRAQEAWKKTPIIMLSGKNSPLDEVQGVLAGCSTYLTKPVKSPEFQKVLKRVTQWIDHFSQNTDSGSNQRQSNSGQRMSYS